MLNVALAVSCPSFATRGVLRMSFKVPSCPRIPPRLLAAT